MDMQRPVTIGVVGAGYWGPNLLRNFNQVAGCKVKWVCDKDPARVQKMLGSFRISHGTGDLDEVLGDPEVDAVVNALPVSHHYSVGARALEAGKHCLIEKPMAMTSGDARHLVALAAERRLVLMAGHTFEYNSAVRKVKEYIETGEIGDVFYINCQRVNLGIIRQDVNALWNLAPHDISILLYWLGVEPLEVSASGASYLQKDLEDLVTANLTFPGNRHAQILVSWLSPEKTRKISVVGSKKMIVYDDVSIDYKIQIYDKRVEVPGANGTGSGDFGDFQLLVRMGDLVVPRIDFVEPLRTECAHFIECCRTGRTPLTDGQNGLRVVRVLEACGRSLRENGRAVRLDEI